eukprot:SAG22_NODE_23_length_31399_cov_35.631313_9_plen_191_part_00
MDDRLLPTQHAALGRFEQAVLPGLAGLPRQVVHGDANDYNVLIAPAALGPELAGPADCAGIGVLDFGDMVETATVCNLAVALAYACMEKDDPLSAAADIVAAYHAVNPLSPAELAVLWVLLGARNVQSVSSKAPSFSCAPTRILSKTVPFLAVCMSVLAGRHVGARAAERARARVGVPGHQRRSGLAAAP